MVVGSLEETERFLWDLRQTSNDLIIEEHAGAIRDVAHKHGLLYSNEPYDMNPASDLDLGSVADIISAEFWSVFGKMVDRQVSCIEATSIAHTMGRDIVHAEAFTSNRDAYGDTPARMKNQTDWALALGINGIIFHTFVHQPLGDEAKPGLSLGPYGVHWNRNQTFWDFLPAYHLYISRCSQMLREGKAVADILYLTPEGAPVTFDTPLDAMQGDAHMRDKKGYNFDAVSPRILKMRAEVQDGRIAFPGGTHYRILILPNVETMTPETLETVTELVKAGATVMGHPPRKSPSLMGYPACDERVQQLSSRLWGEKPQEKRDFGKGWILRPSTATDIQLSKTGKRLYPEYALIADVLKNRGIPEDFQSDAPIRYGHRITNDSDIYFVANTADKTMSANCDFRVSQGRPQLWDPVTGQMRDLPQFTHQGGVTSVPMTFAPHQSNTGGASGSPQFPGDKACGYTRRTMAGHL